jgi:hypothetical protein
VGDREILEAYLKIQRPKIHPKQTFSSWDKTFVDQYNLLFRPTNTKYINSNVYFEKYSFFDICRCSDIVFSEFCLIYGN